MIEDLAKGTENGVSCICYKIIAENYYKVFISGENDYFSVTYSTWKAYIL